MVTSLSAPSVEKEEFEISYALQNIFKIYFLCRQIETDKILQFVNVSTFNVYRFKLRCDSQEYW